MVIERNARTVVSTGQSDDTPAKSVDSDAMSAAPTGLSGNARLVMDSLAADASVSLACSVGTHTSALHRFVAMSLLLTKRQTEKSCICNGAR